jgi:hypothetical protein
MVAIEDGLGSEARSQEQKTKKRNKAASTIHVHLATK